MSGNRGFWRKIKCLHREEFIIVGWTEPEGPRPWLGAVLLAYYEPDGRLTYAGRVGTSFDDAELAQVWQRLQPLAVEKMPLDTPPPRSTRFGSPLVLSRIHCVRPELVAEVKYLTWTDNQPAAGAMNAWCDLLTKYLSVSVSFTPRPPQRTREIAAISLRRR